MKLEGVKALEEKLVFLEKRVKKLIGACALSFWSRAVELTSLRKSKVNRHERNNDKSWNEKDV